MTVTEALARFVVETKLEDFPPDVVKTGRDLLLDGMGAMVRGPDEPISRKIIAHVKEMGGAPRVGVPGARFKTSLTDALLLNGTTVHSIEHEAVGKHTASSPMSLIPAAFAVAEHYGLSGRSVLEGFVLGYEVQGKVGMGCPSSSSRGWTGICFPLGVAACASKMMGLNVEQTRWALGMATDLVGGALRHCGSMAHFIGMGGFPGRHGMTAALLAKEGVTADLDMIDGPGGFGEWLGGYDAEIIAGSLGKPYYVVSPGTAVKKYNCCFGMHRALDALWELIMEHDIRAEDVAKVRVDVSSYVTKLIRYPEPKTGEEAKFSFEHAFAVLLVERPANQITSPKSFSDEGVVDPRYVAVRKLVEVAVTDQPGGRTLVGKAMPVTITMKDGRTFQRESPILKGSGDNPLTDQELADVFREHCSGFMSREQTERALHLLGRLETLPDTRELMQIVTYGREGVPDATARRSEPARAEA
ncbi:MAG: MmgE/PrpD family protein [Lautropia sp.]